MSVTCSNCGTAVQITSSLSHQLPNDNDPLIPFVKAQIDDLTAQNSSLVAENDTLASKLVESTEGRMDLDQQLNIAQMELQAAQSELKTLRENQKHYEQLINMISSGQLIEKKDVQPVIENLAYESQRRSQIETSKLKLESELEDLSRSLFEEANRMVNEERQATYLAGKKIEGLERQLDEVLDLCKSERDQLVELKLRMGKLSDDKDIIQRERDAIEFAFVQLQQHVQQQQQQQQHNLPNSIQHHMSSTAAARRGMPNALSGSPNGTSAGFSGLNLDIAAGSRKQVQQVMQYDARQHRSSASSVKSKTDSCYFSDEDHPGSHLLSDPNEDRIPSLGFHLWDPSFVEFKTYMESILGTAKPSTPSDPLKPIQNPAPVSISSAGLTSMYSFGMMTKPSPPTTAPSANAIVPVSNLLSSCRLLKKISTEDVDATLRFDPGNLLSWAQKKRLVTAVTENTLVVESVPISPGTKDSGAVAKPNCALCGNGITTSLYYQYRLTDTSNESRTICPYCRTRLTSVCTFYSVLRMISKRIISSSTTPEKLYLDFLRIRLSMFLARCGVGIMTGDEVKQKRESSRSQLINLPSTLPFREADSTPGKILNTSPTAQDNFNDNSISTQESVPIPTTIITTNITPVQSNITNSDSQSAINTLETMTEAETEVELIKGLKGGHVDGVIVKSYHVDGEILKSAKVSMEPQSA
ncbi:rab guanine nucleotide exchange factor S2 [Entomortierella beljakovae]|nr:rab guanine nucleotide exchange factor S2 [Entomortierella beljakovae]